VKQHMPSPPTSAEVDRFTDILRAELVSIPLEHWGYFFPATVALWRFIRLSRPDLLGELSAGYKGEPWFRGQGSQWFTSELLNDSRVVDGLDVLMRAMADVVPPSAWDRAFLTSAEVVPPHAETVAALVAAVVSALPAKRAV
jgi:hypothetical protein